MEPHLWREVLWGATHLGSSPAVRGVVHQDVVHLRRSRLRVSGVRRMPLARQQDTSLPEELPDPAVAPLVAAWMSGANGQAAWQTRRASGNQVHVSHSRNRCNKPRRCCDWCSMPANDAHLDVARGDAGAVHPVDRHDHLLEDVPGCGL